MNAEEQNRRLDDTAFNKISPFVTLQKEEIFNYNVLLKEVTDEIIGKLQNDDLFKNIYRNMMFVGSFYKQTRVGKPEEFDINVIISLPDIDKAIIEKGQPGFAKIKFRKEDLSSKWTDNKVLKNWLDADNYLDNERVRRWFESVKEKSFSSLKKCPTNDGYFILPSNRRDFAIKFTKSGPAFTLCVICESKKFSVDFVPVLEFKNSPLKIANKFKNLQNLPWYLVPKPLKDVPKPGKNWRYCFYIHEKEILKSHGKIKPIIRTIKKLRDKQNWHILVSYYIETLFYHELNSNLNKTDVINTSQTNLTVHMLKKLQDSLKKGKLYYFWDDTCNLFQDFSKSQTIGIVNRIEKIIKDVESRPDNLYKHLLTNDELQKLGELDKQSPASTPDTPSSSDSVSSSLSSLSLKGISNFMLQQSPIKVKKTNNLSSEANDISEIRSLKDAVLTLINEVKLLSMKVGTLENKIDRMNQCREHCTEKVNLIQEPLHSVRALLNNFYPQ